MADCAHWYRQELFEEEIAAKDRELRAAYQRTASLEEKRRRIRELTEGVERPNVSSLYDAFEQQRAQANGLANARNNAFGGSSGQQSPPFGLGYGIAGSFGFGW